MKKAIWFALIVAMLAQLACGITVRYPSEEETIEKMLEGRQAVVFGNDQFVTGSKAELEAYGMIVQTAGDLNTAISLSGDDFVELHCEQADGNESVVQAAKPSNILWDGEQPIVQCVAGVIFIGFRTTDNPDVWAP